MLKNISFEIKTAGVTGFLGPNGAGKSTMMKILSGLIAPDSGTAEINGRDVLRHPQEAKRITGYLPEHNPLYTDMYVREFLYMTASIHKVNDKASAVARAIDATGLGAESGKKIGTLSKGYRQRVGLAQNLLHDPEALILDEPTTGLDPNQIVEIRNLIREAGRTKTVMLSSHIMQEVEAICDRTVIINGGEIVADGETASLKMQASGKIVEIEFAEQPDISIFKSADFVEKVELLNDGSFMLKGRGDSDIRAKLFGWAVEGGLTIIAMQQKERRLEDVFRLLTKQNTGN
ncbi:MAG: ATP-binding cassette domain-containing protein [Prevotellaceae bacterium]|nr:ATP-binding cassette domain-containing protein [Prevotellaceae bacterium]